MNVQTVDIKSIRPYWRNPRRIDDAVDSVRESMQRYGYVSLIAVDKSMTIIAGHVRYRALQRLGYEEIQVVVADHLTPEQVRAYRIADNRSSEIAEWNDDKLIEEMRNINDRDFAHAFFDDQEVQQLMGEAEEEEPPEEPAKSASPPPDNKVVEPVESSGSQEEEEDPEDPEEPGGRKVNAICPECGEEQVVTIR